MELWLYILCFIWIRFPTLNYMYKTIDLNIGVRVIILPLYWRAAKLPLLRWCHFALMWLCLLSEWIVMWLSSLVCLFSCLCLTSAQTYDVDIRIIVLFPTQEWHQQQMAKGKEGPAVIAVLLFLCQKGHRTYVTDPSHRGLSSRPRH